MAKTITSLELLPLLETIRGDLLDSTIGFVRPDPDRPNADLGGSGTLVRAAGVRAILTADHVLSMLPEGRPFGLIVFTRTERQFRKIIPDAMGKVSIARGTDESKGPDLGLFVLSSTDAADLEAEGKVFYNLSMRRSRMLCEAPPLDKGCAWVLCGMVGEWTRDVTPERGFGSAKEFRGLCGPVVLAGYRQDGEFDYVSVEIRSDGAYTGPKSFGGCSGGGLWQAILRERNGSVVIDELILAGVAFYQSSDENERRTIECHGRTSVYERALETLERVAGEKGAGC